MGTSDRLVPAVTSRLIGPGDTEALADLFAALDTTHFHPHPFSRDQAAQLVAYTGRDVYAVLVEAGRFVAYGLLRGWDEGYEVPSLGIAVRCDARGRGLGRVMMAWLADEARRRGAAQIRLRVHPDNNAARRLYESTGYRYAGTERGELVMLADLAHGAGSVPPDTLG